MTAISHPLTLGSAVQGLAYGALGLPLAFLALPLYVSLPNHYATQYGLPLAGIGTLLLASRAVDAMADPWIGTRIDRCFARKTPPVMGLAWVSALLLALSFALIFEPPWPASLMWPGLALALILAHLAFSTLSTLHQAWGARLGGDERGRSRVVAWREGLGLGGVLLASVLTASVAPRVTSLVLAVLLGIALLLLAHAPEPGPDRQGDQHTDIGLPWRNPRFARLLSLFMLNGIASAVPATLVVFFINDRLQSPQHTPLLLGAYFLAAGLSVPFWSKLVPRLGLPRLWLTGMAIAVTAFVGTLGLQAGQTGLFALICMASGIALGADLIAPAALLTGVIQQGGDAHGAEGAYAGWWNAAAKLNLALAAGATLPLLSWAGYSPSDRSAGSLQALSLAYVLLPCILKTMTIALLMRWQHLLTTPNPLEPEPCA